MLNEKDRSVAGILTDAFYSDVKAEQRDYVAKTARAQVKPKPMKGVCSLCLADEHIDEPHTKWCPNKPTESR